MSNKWKEAPIKQQSKLKQAPSKADFKLWRERKGSARTNSFIHGTAKGVAGLLGLPIDTATNVLNLAIAGYGTATAAMGRPDLSPDPITNPFGGSESMSRGLNKLGFETENQQPWDKISRGAHTGGIIIGSSALPVKATTARAAFRPVETVASSAAGGGASMATDDPSLIGLATMGPPIAGGAAARGTQIALSKTQAGKNAQQNVDLFGRAGTTPNLGQATESPFLLAMQSVLSKLPGGHKPLLGHLKRQQEDVGISAGKLGSAETAGRRIESGIEKFQDRTSLTWKNLDRNLQSAVGEDARVAPTNTFNALDDLAGTVKEATSAASTVSSKPLLKLRSGFKSDMAGDPPERVVEFLGSDGKVIHSFPIGGTPNKVDLPVSDLRVIRTQVGAMLDRTLEGVSRGELKKVYGAISDDLYAAALRADGGTPGKAVHAWERQNKYWKARNERIETALDRVLGNKKLPEEIFAAANPKNREQVNLIRQVMRSLKTDEREVVSQAIVGRLGRATPGQQTDVGDVFSTDTFLKNWNNLSDGAKVQIIPNATTRLHLQSIAKTSSRIKESGKTGEEFAGRFGSLSQVVFLSVIAGGGYAASGSGVLGTALGAAGVAGTVIPAIRVTGNLMTNPEFVKWVANSTKPVNQQQYAQRLAVIYNTSNEQTRLDLESFMTSIDAAMQKQSN